MNSEMAPKARRSLAEILHDAIGVLQKLDCGRQGAFKV
jgi:hypothetical protein